MPFLAEAKNPLKQAMHANATKHLRTLIALQVIMQKSKVLIMLKSVNEIKLQSVMPKSISGENRNNGNAKI